MGVKDGNTIVYAGIVETSDKNASPLRVKLGKTVCAVAKKIESSTPKPPAPTYDINISGTDVVLKVLGTDTGTDGNYYADINKNHIAAVGLSYHVNSVSGSNIDFTITYYVKFDSSCLGKYVNGTAACTAKITDSKSTVTLPKATGSGQSYVDSANNFYEVCSHTCATAINGKVNKITLTYSFKGDIN